uniref:Solute carrier organic anion transporter family member n=1 Tax=Amblyomma aureolatum TaxID=187763 RepID=A0A1E1X5A7_9ACAR
MTLISGDRQRFPRDDSVSSLGTMTNSQSNEPLVVGKPPVIPDTVGLPDTAVHTGGMVRGYDEDAGGTCGWGCLRPSWLQRFRTPPWVLFFLCWAGFLQGLIVNGFVNVVITTIERRFQLRSSESGLVASGYDIASFLLLAPISYFGGSRSKPLFVGVGCLVLGLGAFVFSLPHFLAGSYAFSTEDDRESLCRLATNATQGFCGRREVGSLNQYKYMFLAGQMLHGAGSTPFFTLGCTYLDEIVSTKMSSVYIGIFYTMAIIGPALGYILGGQFLKIYTDLSVDASALGLTPSSGVWVGAWWIGFVVSSVTAIVAAIPISAFPKVLPGSLKLQAQKKSEMHQKLQKSEAVQSGFGARAKDLPASFKILITNPTFVFLSLAGATEGMLVSGLATFLPKVIEFQFSIAASLAALIMGAVTVPGAGGGTFLGGYFVKKFNLRCAGIIKMCVLCSLVPLVTIFAFFFSCPNVRFAGVNYKTNNVTVGIDRFLSDCNNQCHCQMEDFDPICGTDHVMYYSACFAGCQEMHLYGSTKVYEDCRCIDHPGKNITVNGKQVNIQAERDKCPSECNFLVFFLIAMFVCMVFTFLVSMPSLAATLRCVAASQKSFGLGIQWIAVRLLGTIPAPIMFGYLIDQSCVLWPGSCDDSGACAVYENGQMARNLLALLATVKFLSCLFFFLSWLLYKAPEGGDEEEDGNGTPTAAPEKEKSGVATIKQETVVTGAPFKTATNGAASGQQQNHSSDNNSTWF